MATRISSWPTDLHATPRRPANSITIISCATTAMGLLQTSRHGLTWGVQVGTVVAQLGTTITMDFRTFMSPVSGRTCSTAIMAMELSPKLVKRQESLILTGAFQNGAWV